MAAAGPPGENPAVESRPAIDYATSTTPRPRRGGIAVLNEPEGLRIVKGPSGWTGGSVAVMALLTAFPALVFWMATNAYNSRGHATHAAHVFAFILIVVGVFATIGVVVLWFLVHASTNLVTEIKIGPKRVTSSESDSKKLHLWPRESVAGFTVLVDARSRYAALCLSTHDYKNPVLINFLTQADAHSLAAACNAELAKPVPTSPIISPDDYVSPDTVPDAAADT